MNAVLSLVRRIAILICAGAVAIAPFDGASAARTNSNSNTQGSGNGTSSAGTKSSTKSNGSTRATSRTSRSTGKSTYQSRPKKPARETPPKRNPPKYPPKQPPKYPPVHPKPPKPYPPKEGMPRPPKYPPYRPLVIALPPPIIGPTLTPPTTTFVAPSQPGGPARTPRQRRPSVVPPANELVRSRDREIIITMDDTTNDGDTIVLGQGLTLNVEVQYRSALLGVKVVRLRIPDNRPLAQVLQQVIQAGTTDPRIIDVQPNYVFQTAQSSTAAAIRPLPQYALDKVRLGEAHQAAIGRNVRVAVIDTGMDGTHPDLVGAITESFDAIGEGPPDTEAHGTAIAGVLAARRQIRGAAPGSRVLAVRAFSAAANQRSQSTTLSLIKALDWAVANDARVVNMSFAGPEDPLLQRAIEAADARGLILVAAAGNEGPKAAFAYPAAYSQVIAVTASDSDDQVYDQANRGSYIAVAAPGVDIIAPAPAASYEVSSGTSLAAAQVSGIIALILERQPTMTSVQIRALLARTARDPDRSAAARGLGAGIVDAAKAVSEAK